MRKQIATASAAFALWVCCGAAQAVVALVELPAVDVQAALAKDAEQHGVRPFRFAVPVAIVATPTTDGLWSTAADGRARWQLAVHSAAATSLNFGFTHYALPAGAELRLLSADGATAAGPYGSEYNAQGQLWTPIVRSDTVTIELLVPAAARDAVRLNLTTVNHGFRGFGAKDGVTAKSGTCNIDVVCADGDGWRDEIRSVARYTIGGALLCTGTLVNNSAQDFTPYFLTANHCVMTAAQAPTTVFYWNYQTSKCGGAADGKLDQTQSGALFLAGSGGGTEAGSDFTLMQLLAKPNAAFKVFYAGWDRRNIAPVGATGIHHPNGDEKRISTDVDQLLVSAYSQQPGTTQSSLMPTHLMVTSWDRGVTEGGSSGSGIWNREHRLVGQLSGGSSSCAAPKAPDWYGRMFMNFASTGTATTANSLSSRLDPKGDTEVLNGADPASAPTTPASGMTGSGGGGSTTTVPGSSGASGGSSGSSNASSRSGGGGALGLALLLGLLPVALRRHRR